MVKERSGKVPSPVGGLSRASGALGLMRARAGCVVWANNAFASMFRYDAASLVGMSLDLLYPDLASRERVRAAATAVTATGAAWQGEVRLVRRDGTIGMFTVTWSGFGPDPDEYAGSFVDISAFGHSFGDVVRSEARLRGILEAMSEGLVALAADGRIVDANLAAEQILGFTRGELLGHGATDPRWRVVREDGSPFPHDELPTAVTLHTGRAVRERLIGVESKSAGRRWLRINTQPICVGDPPVLSGVVATFTDITESRLASSALQAAREDLQLTLDRMRAITESVPMSIVLYDDAHRIQFANDRYRRLGRPGLVAEGMQAEEFLKPSVLRDSADARRRALAGESVRMMVHAPFEGELRQREVTFVPYRDATGRVTGVLALGYDVTELESSRARLREALDRLAAVREAERHEIAMALHEGVAQELYAARLGVEQLRRATQDGGGIAALDDIHAIIEQAVRGIGAQTSDLYPTALQHLALADVITQHAAKFQERSGIQVSVTASAALPDPVPDLKLLLFRAAQEALTNVWRHARAATRATISLSLKGNALWLVVEDDGAGFAPGADTKAGSLGLLAIRERFTAAGGGLRVGATPKGGASVSVWVPTSGPSAQ